MSQPGPCPQLGEAAAPLCLRALLELELELELEALLLLLLLPLAQQQQWLPAAPVQQQAPCSSALQCC